jgi:hypothetical protein
VASDAQEIRGVQDVVVGHMNAAGEKLSAGFFPPGKPYIHRQCLECINKQLV